MSGRVFWSCSANALIQSNFELISRLDKATELSLVVQPRW